ncbi:MAG: hypothetical protein V4507_13030 [Verrucomicrobiota bacterium]
MNNPLSYLTVKPALFFTLLFAFLILPISSSWGADEDLLPVDLSEWKLPNWNTLASIEKESDGTSSFRLETKIKDWSQQITYLVEYPTAPAKIVFSGRMKTQGVVGGQAFYEKARAQIVFLDKNGAAVGGWPTTTDYDGTKDWTAFEQTHTPPADAKFVKVMIGHYVSTGVAWYDHLNLTAYDAAGNRIEPLPSKKFEVTDTKGWWTFKDEAEDPERPLVIDLSKWIPKPAGEFGFVKVKEGHFAFEKGDRIRFWGTGYGSMFPQKEAAAKEAARLPRFGVNIVRLHGLDASHREKSIFDMQSDKTDRLDPEKLDRLDYYIAELKKNGVYVNLNLLTKRLYLAGDGVRDYDKLYEGGKAASMFNRQLIDLQKDYARLILTHVNPYTKLAYKDDPVIAMVETINESHLFEANQYGGMPPSYDKELEQLFEEWIKKNNLSRPEGRLKNLITQRNKVAFQFLLDTQNAYYREMSDYLIKEIGIKVPLAGSNQGDAAIDVLSNTNLNYIDRHAYWDHPNGGWEPTAIFTNQSLIRARDSQKNMVTYLARQHVEGMPYTVSEWNNVWPNEWIIEGPTLMASYGGFQDWDGLMIFGFTGQPYKSRMEHAFSIDSKPHMLASFVSASLQFLRGDVRPGPILRKPLSMDHYEKTAGNEFSQLEVLTHRTLLNLDPSKTTPDATSSSESTSLSWEKDRFLINTPCTQGYVGFSKNNVIKTADLTVTPQTDFAQIVVQSLDSLPLSQSKHLFVTAVARAENNQQTYQLFKHGLMNEGKGPIFMEPVQATVSFKGAHSEGEVKMFLLDSQGRRTTATLPITPAEGGQYAFTLNGAPATWYEILIP